MDTGEWDLAVRETAQRFVDRENVTGVACREYVTEAEMSQRQDAR